MLWIKTSLPRCKPSLMFAGAGSAMGYIGQCRNLLVGFGHASWLFTAAEGALSFLNSTSNSRLAGRILGREARRHAGKFVDRVRSGDEQRHAGELGKNVLLPKIEADEGNSRDRMQRHHHAARAAFPVFAEHFAEKAFISSHQ